MFPAQPDVPFLTLRRRILKQLTTPDRHRKPGRHPDRRTVQQPALDVWLALARKPPDATAGPLDPVAEPVRDLLQALRGWTAAADRVTWRLLWWQAAVFLLAALALLLVPLTLYF
jgi:hypothetical protein